MNFIKWNSYKKYPVSNSLFLLLKFYGFSSWVIEFLTLNELTLTEIYIYKIKCSTA